MIVLPRPRGQRLRLRGGPSLGWQNRPFTPSSHRLVSTYYVPGPALSTSQGSCLPELSGGAGSQRLLLASFHRENVGGALPCTLQPESQQLPS